jgi:agmatine/peptidylarginine deiminase
MTWNQINKILTNGFQNILNKKFIIIDVGVLSGDDTDGHIDNLVRLDQPNVLYFMATDDKSHPDYELLKDLKNQISNNNFGKRKIIPINHNLTDIVKNNVNEILPFSYLNYIRIGEIIYMPINKFTNERKKIEIKNIFKNSNVRFILCNSLLNEKGGLHCFSMNIIKDKEI